MKNSECFKRFSLFNLALPFFSDACLLITGQFRRDNALLDSWAEAPVHFIACSKIKYRNADLKATAVSTPGARPALNAAGKCWDVEKLWWMARQFIGLLNQRVEQANFWPFP